MFKRESSKKTKRSFGVPWWLCAACGIIDNQNEITREVESVVATAHEDVKDVISGTANIIQDSIDTAGDAVHDLTKSATDVSSNLKWALTIGSVAALLLLIRI